ncbi:MAG: mtnB 2 [Acidobacteria bacterium]|nr:mtnB 2 [Acidobacteriota bacterium]
MTTGAEEQIRADIVEAGRRLYARAYIASNDGNISARLDDRRLIATPKGVCKGFMTPDMMVIVDYEGGKIAGDRDPSTELPMHLEIYRNRPDANAVVHAHPPHATGFAVAGIPLTRAVLAEVITTLGSIPIAAYGTPSTSELPDAVRKYIKAHDGMLLANHGAVTCGRDVLSAYYKMETIEHFAKISLVARLLGGEHLISREEVERLQGLRGFYGIPAPAPLCADPSEAGGDRGEQVVCQVLEAPESPAERLVPDVSLALRQARGPQRASLRDGVEESRDGEIRLTYGELTALIADAVKTLKS